MLCLRNAREIFRKFSLYYLYLQITCRKAGGRGGRTLYQQNRRREKMIYSYEEMRTPTFDTWQLKIWRETRQILGSKTKIVQDSENFELLNMNFCTFSSEETNEKVWFLECLKQVFVWSFAFWVFKLSRVKCVYELAKFSLPI